ncbi:hypothetical protein [Adlercreutzia murintestinalis]|jgi:hypothetical protein|uniref:hypothetical protein n=1 Tax=Adlercreutzia murintestinalis TaxID=2941325 RepID=UPI00203EA57B|nr:hypothetical protein [Adlercreutzia murintestinalis]
MKKTSKLLGSIALTAALALGTAVPAFAAPSTDANGDFEPVVTWNTDEDGNIVPETIKDGVDAGADTPVYIDVKRSNIDVAVPIELRLVAETAGGSLICPSDGVYSVINYSTNTAVYINKVEVQYNEEVNKDGVNWLLVQDSTLVGDGVEPALGGPAFGNLLVKLNAPGAVSADSYVLDVDNPKVPTQASAWKISKAVDDGDGGIVEKRFPLNFDASSESSIVEDADAANIFSQGDGAEKAAADAFKLKYTISTARPIA